MMKLKMLVSRSGPAGAQSPGDEIEVSDAEGKRMIAAGQAMPLRGEVRETATKAKPKEKAVKK